VAYTMEDLLSVLHPCCPAEADALCKTRRRVEHGLTTVGLKIINRDTALAAATVLTGFGQGGGDPLRCPGAAVAIPAVGRAIDAIRPRRGIGAVLGDKPGAGGFEDGGLLAGIAGNGHRVTTSHLRSPYHFH
jgi:hypothetical protein